MYASIVERKIRQTFAHVNGRRWDEATEDLVPHVRHRVSGFHALGGERRGKEAVRGWFERFGRVFPDLRVMVEDVWVKGWPWHTTVFVRWNGIATLLNGAPYANRGLHVFTIRWAKVHEIEEFFDSQTAAGGLATQAAAGMPEAAAQPLSSEPCSGNPGTVASDWSRRGSDQTPAARQIQPRGDVADVDVAAGTKEPGRTTSRVAVTATRS